MYVPLQDKGLGSGSNSNDVLMEGKTKSNYINSAKRYNKKIKMNFPALEPNECSLVDWAVETFCLCPSK